VLINLSSVDKYLYTSGDGVFKCCGGGCHGYQIALVCDFGQYFISLVHTIHTDDFT